MRLTLGTLDVLIVFAAAFPSVCSGTLLTEVEDVRLVLTPQSTELDDVTKFAFVRLFDDAFENFVGMQQSLLRHSEASDELEVEVVSSSIIEQIVDSVFVLGAENVGGGTGEGKARTLLSDLASAKIVSSLALTLSTSASLSFNDGMERPNLSEYMKDFFSEASDTDTAFLHAARHIHDGHGHYPLEGLVDIGVGQSKTFPSPYSYLDREAETRANTLDNLIGNDFIISSIVNGNVDGTQQKISEPGKFTWVTLTLIGACVSLLMAVGLLVVILRKSDKAPFKRPEITTSEGASTVKGKAEKYFHRNAPTSVRMNRNDPLPQTSPISFQGDSYTPQNTQRRGGLRPEGVATPSGKSRPTGKNSGMMNYCDEGNCDNDRAVKSSWKDTFAALTGLGVLKPFDSAETDQDKKDNSGTGDEDSQGNAIPKLDLPPKQQRKQKLSTQCETIKTSPATRFQQRRQKAKSRFNRSVVMKESTSTSPHKPQTPRRHGQRTSVVDDLLGGGHHPVSIIHNAVSPHDGLHLPMSTSDNLYVIPEDDASI